MTYKSAKVFRNGTEFEIFKDNYENFYCAYGEARTPKERDGR